MNKLSKKTLITSLIYICLWIMASILLYPESNGKVIMILGAVAVIFRIKSLINKDNEASAGL